MQSIRILREITGVSAGALAEQLQISPYHLSKVENGATRPSDRLILHIIEALEPRLPGASSPTS